jgi:RNA polymerase sigma-70 factor, ECF subfamily
MDPSRERDFTAFYDATWARTVACAYAMTGVLGDAEDLAQEAYSRAWPRWSSLREYDDPGAWVRQLATGLAVSRWRRAPTAAGFLASSRGPEHVAPPSETTAALVGALKQLPEAQRRAVRGREAAAGTHAGCARRPAPARASRTRRSNGGGGRRRRLQLPPRGAGPAGLGNRRSSRRGGRAPERIMTTIVTLVVVSLGSLAFRLTPLLGAGRVPDPAARVAGWAGASVLVAIAVRSVLHHQDTTTPWATLVAAVSVAIGLVLAMRGRSIQVVLVAAVVSYSALALLLRHLL